MRNFVRISICFFALSFAACNKSDDPQNNNEYTPIELDLKSASLVESSNTFGANIFKEVLQDVEEGENALISPLSIFQALSMTRNGAKGETLTQMNNILAFDESLGDEINQYQKKLVDVLRNADNKLTLDIANSIWYRDDVTVLPDFIKVNQEYFKAEVSALDFSDAEGAKKTINNWVDDTTNGKIPQIVDQVTPEHVMFLINAIYFYGEWQNEFDKRDTKEASFYTETGAETKVDMMHQQADLGYAQNDLFSMVEMPYGNGHFNMVVLKPNTGKTVTDIVEATNDNSWSLWMNSLTARTVVLGFPKFKIEGDYQLNKPLINMGMSLAFDQFEADFSGILEGGGIYISKVKHKTFIEVDEKGTEAAAVTSVEIAFTSVGPNQPIHFSADRPFIFAITEKDTNTILFMGRCMQPE
ncbi:serpin family protein [Saccharicrinis sp. GN24d3]|uniref:serpin family protein n=1 Tax=Saccharicrinis sp. GN24d3 TaxID=3458416 RepID=UPI004034F722